MTELGLSRYLLMERRLRKLGGGGVRKEQMKPNTRNARVPFKSMKEKREAIGKEKKKEEKKSLIIAHLRGHQKEN
jgi:hypothetical protein